jgi:hypothetical protein
MLATEAAPRRLMKRLRQVSMQDEAGSADRKAAARRSEWRGLIELVIGSAVISLIFLLAIFVALAN